MLIAMKFAIITVFVFELLYWAQYNYWFNWNGQLDKLIAN